MFQFFLWEILSMGICTNCRYNDELRQEIQKLSADIHKYKQAAKVIKTEVSCQVCEEDIQTGLLYFYVHHDLFNLFCV